MAAPARTDLALGRPTRPHLGLPAQGPGRRRALLADAGSSRGRRRGRRLFPPCCSPLCFPSLSSSAPDRLLVESVRVFQPHPRTTSSWRRGGYSPLPASVTPTNLGISWERNRFAKPLPEAAHALAARGAAAPPPTGRGCPEPPAMATAAAGEAAAGCTWLASPRSAALLAAEVNSGFI